LRIDAVGAAWRGCADDAADTGDLRGADAHDGGRDQRVLAAGDIAADGADRDELLAEDNTGLNFRLEGAEAVLLAPGELCHVAVADREIFLESLRKGGEFLPHLVLADAEVARPLVEVARILAHR